MTKEEKPATDVSDMMHSAMVFGANTMDNPKEWLLDTEATHYVCSNRKMFSSYVQINRREPYMGNSTTSKIEGIGKLILKMTLGKELTLNDVLHVPDILKNLVSNSLLSKNGFKLVFESNNFILTKNEVYVGKGYLTNGLFKINVMTILWDFNDNKVSSFAYLLESFNLWHDILGHVNFNSLRKLRNLNLLPNFHIDPNHNYESVEAELNKTPFHSIEKEHVAFIIN